MIRRAFNTALRRASTILIGFGLVLVLVGVGVQATRALRVQRAQEHAAAPSFEASVRVADADRLDDVVLDLSDDVAAFVPWDPVSEVRYIPLAVLRRPRFSKPTPSPTPTAEAAPIDAAAPERIIIPSLKLDRRVVEIGWDVEMVDNDALRSVWQIARHAAGFHRGSAPVGAPGNTVISGHNNVDGAVFGELHQLEPGDRVMLQAGGEMRVYEVEMNFIVQEEGVPFEQRRENARWIGETPDERLTLVTCYPPWGNTHRTIVVARPVADQAGALGREGVR